MNHDSIRADFGEKNENFSILNVNLQENLRRERNEKNLSGLGMSKPKSKCNLTIRAESTATYAQCFSGNNFTSQYEEECPVNYSLKYSETESCKCINKCETTKKKFKDYSDYAETDLDQPTDFSLKYAEKTYDDENKNVEFTYFNNHKVRFKEYTDYVETDLDQPTDFTLKYRESAEEDVKNEFNFYESEERKTSCEFGARTVPEDSERLRGRFASQDETPLMFSRSSSLNSLSSFVHITQSTPDDRSSIVSDFSRMTSGLISPSDLPDSPTQTAPSSPKRVKPSVSFSSKSDFTGKQSVFEDDVASYKQEDTPIEFSRATSLSSLNIENPIKSELVIKQNTINSSTDIPREETLISEEDFCSDHSKQDVMPEKVEQEKGKFELASVLEVDESLFADCINIDIQINCRKPKANQGRLIMTNEGSASFRQGTGSFRQGNGFTLKPNLRLRFHNDSRKAYSPYELSDDAVHTYHTEGTPANVSHAGSHTDLSALSIVSGIPLAGADDNSDSETFFAEGTDNICMAEGNTLEETVGGNSEPILRNSDKVTQLDFLRKDHDVTAKDESAKFKIESSCNFLKSSLGGLTVNVIDPPLNITGAENCEEISSQMLSPLRNVSPQSPNSTVFEEAEDAEKSSELESEFVSSKFLKERNDAWNGSNAAEETENNTHDMDTRGSTVEFSDSANIDFDSNLPLTAFEEALLEECIRLGMPRKKNHQQLQETYFKLTEEGKESEEGKFNYYKSISKEVKFWKEIQPLCVETGDAFDFDSSEPLTPFEEVLLEQCIQLGMPQKKTLKNSQEIHVKDFDEEEIDCDSGRLITPLESALVEQCIRLGMSQKKSQKGSAPCEESQKTLSCLAIHLNRLKINLESDKDKDKKREGCACGKRHAFRRKNNSCRRTKNKNDHLKVESSPV